MSPAKSLETVACMAVVLDKSAASKRGAKSRRKGASGMREYCAFAAPWFPGLRPNLSQVRGAKLEGGDTVGGPSEVHDEIKRYRRCNLPAALTQAIADAAPGKIPVAHCRDDRGEWRTVLRTADFLPLLRDALAYRNSVAIELVVGTEEDEREAEKALSQNDAVARALPLFGGAS